MELHLVSFLIVCPLVFLAGFVDSIAGGGGLISLPAYLLAGLPVHNALATNKLSSTTGTVISAGRMIRHKFADMRLAIPSVATALAGSWIGANLTLHTSDRVLKMVMLFVLPVVAFYVLRKKDLEPKHQRQIARKWQYVIVTTASFFIGIYDGFYGPGTGTFLLLIFTSLAGMNVRTASGTVKLVNLSSNVSALVTFILAGKVIWGLGLVAAVFSIAGHYVGSGMVMKNGTKIVRPVIVGVLAVLFVKIVTGF